MAGTSLPGVWESLTIEIGNQATKFHIDHVVQMCGHHEPFFRFSSSTKPGVKQHDLWRSFNYENLG